MSAGKLLQGQEYRTQKDLAVRYTQQEMDDVLASAYLGDARTEVTPTDRGSSLVKVFSEADFDEAAFSYTSFVNLSNLLPPVLKSVTVDYNVSKGQGEAQEDNIASSSGNVNLTVSLQGSAQSSAALMPDISFEIEQVWAQNVEATNYVFYMPAGSTSTAAVIAKILSLFGATVLAWPRMRPKSHVLTARGKQVSLQVNASVTQHNSFQSDGSQSDFHRTWGQGFSLDGGVTTRSVELPPTLHGTIIIENNTRQETVIAKARAVITGGENFPPYTEEIIKETEPIMATVSPTILPATSPAGIPSSGNYIIDMNTDEDEFGMNKYVVTVVDFSIL